MNIDKSSEQQDIIYHKILSDNEYKNIKINNSEMYFDELKSIPRHIIKKLFPQSGEYFCQFIELADATHPDFPQALTINGKRYFDDINFLNELLEMCKILDYTEKQKFSLDITKNCSYSDLELHIVKLFNLRYLRLIKDKFERNKFRSLKRNASISTTIVGESKLNVDSFDTFIRGADPYAEIIKNLKEKEPILNDIGCKSLQFKLLKTLDSMGSVNKKHYGFNHINLSDAIKPIAYLNGFKYTDAGFVTSGKSFGFEDVKITAKFEKLNYTIFERIPERVSKIVDFLEEYPGIGGKPLFDAFFVLVAGPSPSITKFSSKEEFSEYSKVLNKNLLQEGKTIGVLLGELDDRSYFISYWI